MTKRTFKNFDDLYSEIANSSILGTQDAKLLATAIKDAEINITKVTYDTEAKNIGIQQLSTKEQEALEQNLDQTNQDRRKKEDYYRKFELIEIADHKTFALDINSMAPGYGNMSTLGIKSLSHMSKSVSFGHIQKNSENHDKSSHKNITRNDSCRIL